MSEHAVHMIDVGLMQIQEDREVKVVIVEYGGEPVTTADSDDKKLEILKQIWHVTSVLHESGYAIYDFKPEHWTFFEIEDGLDVKLIDYTQIVKVPEESIRRNENDHRQSDLRNYVGLMQQLFPWFGDYGNYWHGTYDEINDRIRKTLLELENQNRALKPTEKRRRQYINRLAQVLRGRTS